MATRTRATTTKTSRDITAELEYLTRALKAPTTRESIERLAERAREESWTHEEFLAACLQREVSARETHGGEGRIRAARFPARKSLEDFDYDHARGLKRETIAHLGTLDFVAGKENVVLLGPPGTGNRAGGPGLPGRTPRAVRHRIPVGRSARRGPPRRPPARRAAPPGPLPGARHRRGRIHPVRARGRKPVLPARLITLRTGQPDRHVQQNFARWGEVFGDDTVAAAMIDRLVHHAEIVTLKGDSYRLRNRKLGRVPAAVNEEN